MLHDHGLGVVHGIGDARGPGKIRAVLAQREALVDQGILALRRADIVDVSPIRYVPGFHDERPVLPAP